MINFKFTLQYDGGRYDGWQRQGNTENTIQGKLEHVLGELIGHKVEINGAGRTDAGVHARAQVAHCPLQTTLTPLEVRDYCNRYLPRDIAVTACEQAEDRFHARLNARGKRYVYRLWTGEVPNVFERRFITSCPERPSLERMQEAAVLFTGTHDFLGFSSVKRPTKSTTRTLHTVMADRIGDEIRVTMEGDGFLHNMARILAGTLVEIGAGTRPLSDIEAAFTTRDRANAGRTMPPQGLILDEVFY